jgi:hypothetical protein
MKRLHRIGLVSFAALLLASTASTASAQTLFVDGAAFAAIERRNRMESSTSGMSRPPDQDMSGTVAGGSGALGVWLTPHVSVRLEVGWPAKLERTVDQLYPIPAYSTIGGISLPYGYRSSSQVWDQARTFAPLIAWHTERRHGIQLGFIGGPAFVARIQRVRAETIYPLFTPEVLAATSALGLSLIRPSTTDVKTTTYSVTAQAGLDADIAVGGRLSVVPQVRVIGLEDGLSIRPGVGVRVRF